MNNHLTRLFLACLFVPLLFSCSEEVAPPVDIVLDQNWEFRKAGEDKWWSATVPGTVHTDLMEHDLIPDPFYRFNEDSVQWIEQADWEYRTTFTIEKEQLGYDRMDLNFQGLDTYADVYINEQKVVSADNMFREWVVNAKEYLKAGENTVRIYFHSPVNIGLEKMKKFNYQFPAQNEQAPQAERTNVHTRKAAYHYGWDWGPRLVTSGIWRPVVLKAWNTARIDDAFFRLKKLTKTKATYSADLSVESEVEGSLDLKLFVGSDRVVKQSVSLKPGMNTLSVPFDINNPELWWPNGYGNQHLYQLEVKLSKNGQEVGTLKKRIGVRTVEVVQEKGKAGTSFYFKVNGEPVFMKGANYIPPDNFNPRVETHDYRRVINDAQAAHMNMLRVWGGAIYENDYFYDLCAESGIMVWQDFMFGCSMYPDNAEYLESVKAEATYNVKRLRNNPAVAIWVGNNESQGAWHHWGWQKAYDLHGEDSVRVWQAYEKIFHELLPEVVAENDPDKLYWPSSPSSAFGELSNKYSGDVHDWDVWFGQLPFQHYNDTVGRFISEYGFQSYPDMKTINKFAKQEDLEWNSELMEFRQRSPMSWIAEGFDGNDMIRKYMGRYYKIPNEFEDYVYVSQLLQARALKTAGESFRRQKPYCMGSLYWQIDDCWPTISWATVDYYGRWKAAHYAIKKAYTPLMATAEVRGDVLNVYTVSDVLKDKPGELEIGVYTFDGTEINKVKKDVVLKANQSEVQFTDSFKSFIKEADTTKIFMVVRLEVDDKEYVNTYMFARDKYITYPEVEIDFDVDQDKRGVHIELESDGFARGVRLEFEGLEGHFSDNYFDLLQGEEIEVDFLFKDLHLNHVEDLEDKLKVTSLVDVYSSSGD